MVEFTSDIIATVRLLSTEQGGRKSPIVATEFSCIFEHEGEKNDCRLVLEGKGDVWPGQQITVPIKFLHPELVRPQLRVGDAFDLLEGRLIARGTIDHIVYV